MQNSKKVLVTAAGPNMRPVLNNYSLPLFEKFAKEHNYSIHVEDLAEDCHTRKGAGAKKARWSKIPLLRRALESHDIVVWFDADVLICRTDEDIADYLDASSFQGLVLHSVPAEDRINPNTECRLSRIYTCNVPTCCAKITMSFVILPKIKIFNSANLVRRDLASGYITPFTIGILLS